MFLWIFDSNTPEKHSLATQPPPKEEALCRHIDSATRTVTAQILPA